MNNGGCPFHKIPDIKEFDALDPSARENPWPYYDWLRSIPGNAIYRLPQEENFFLVHRYEDVKTVFADTENFSSKIIPSERAAFPALMDGAEHARIREVMAEIFHQKNILAYETQIRDVIKQATRNLLQNQPVELFDTWANVIPLATLSVLFGFDRSPEFLMKLHRDSIAINRALFVTGGTGPRRSPEPTIIEKIKITGAVLGNAGKLWRLRRLVGSSSMNELLQMVRIREKNIPLPRPNFEHIPAAVSPMLDLLLMFAGKLKEPGNQNASINILRAAMSPGKISFTEMMMTGAFIFFAGYETTSSLLSNCVVHLARNPEQIMQLKTHPEKLEDFIEEALRFYTPVGRFLRRAKKDITFNETRIPKDSIVILMSGAANTDPEKFSNGCAFDMHRENNRQHLSFGKGAHFCVGAPLARLQVTMALRELIQNVKSITIDESYPLKMVTDRDNGILRYEKLYLNMIK